MAHEAAHVVQQRGSSAAAQPFSPGDDNAYEAEAEQASAAVLRGESFKVQQQTSPRPQGLLGIDLPDPLDWLANKANVIPGFRMFTIILGVNPINMTPVARSAANILRALIEFLPGGGLITQALDNSGVFEKAGAFVEKQIATLGMTGSAIKTAVTAFIKGLSLRRIITDPGGVWDSAKRIFTDPIDRIKAFGVGLVTGIIEIIKDAILKPIAKLAEGTEGYNLLKGILGKDPITGEPVTRSAETLLGPLLKMIGLGDVWQKMQDAKAIPRCWAWFQSTMGQLLSIVSSIPGEFIAAFKSLTLEDIILVPKAFIKLGKVFVGFVGKFVTWGVNAMWELLKIVFDVVSPGAWGYIQKTGAALKSILKNPLPFVGNLVKAAKLGFTNFAGNFLTHLKKGLIDWLTGSLEGVYIPKALSLIEFGKMALSILGITWAQIRGKIVKALGPGGETIMKVLEGVFDVVVALVTGGPAAAWEIIKDKLTGLKDTIVQGIIDFIKDAVVTKAIPKLIAMFIPGAGFISAIISIYDTVKVFVQKISKIIQVVTAFINSIVAIAAGNIGAAAAKVESILSGLLSLAISFLAGFVGLGKVSNKIMEVVKKIRGTVDKALDAAAAWIVAQVKKLGGMIKGKDARTPEEKQRDLNRAVQELRPRVAQLVRKGVPRPLLALRLAVWRRQYKLTSLSVEGGKVMAAINPTAEMYSAQEMQIGAALEPILQRAEAAFLRSVRQRPASRARIAGAQQALRAGGRMPAGMTPIERTVVIRSVLRGQVAVPQTPVQRSSATRATIMERGPGTPYELQMRWPGGGAPTRALVNDPDFPPFPRSGRLTYHYQYPSQRAGRPLPSAHLPGQPAPTYGGVNIWAAQNAGQPMHPAIAGLSGEVETARAEGMIAAHTVAGAIEGLPLAAQRDPRQQGGAPVVAGPAERVHGLTAGMATPESASAAETRRTTGAAPTDPNQARAEQVRHGSYAVIFQTLRQALQSGGSVLGEPGSPLRELATAFDAWLQAALPKNFDADDKEVARLARDLQNRLAAFLRQQIPK